MAHEEKPKSNETIISSWFNGGDEPDPEGKEGPSDDEAQPSPSNDAEDTGDDEGVDMGDEVIEPLPPVTQEDDN